MFSKYNRKSGNWVLFGLCRIIWRWEHCCRACPWIFRTNYWELSADFEWLIDIFVDVLKNASMDLRRVHRHLRRSNENSCTNLCVSLPFSEKIFLPLSTEFVPLREPASRTQNYWKREGFVQGLIAFCEETVETLNTDLCMAHSHLRKDCSRASVFWMVFDSFLEHRKLFEDHLQNWLFRCWWVKSEETWSVFHGVIFTPPH